MRNTILKVILLCVVLTGIFSCSKDEEEPAVIDYVKDVESLMRNMSIPGSKLKDGDIPVPTGTKTDAIVGFPSTIVVTSNSLFSMPVEATTTNGRVPRMAFIKLAGSSQYYQVEFDQNGNILGRSPNNTNLSRRMSCTGGYDVQLVAGAAAPPYENNAEVVFYSPPLQSTQILDPSFFNNRQFWSTPRTIKFKAIDVGTGDVQVSLTWDTRSDIDLWLIEPNGNKIYYGNKRSASGGELDYDNTFEYGPENIFYKNAAPAGTYKVQVNYFGGTPLTNFNVVVKNGSSINSYSGSLTNGQTKDVITFTK